MTGFEIQIIALILVAFIVGVGIGYLLRTRVFPVDAAGGESGGLTLESRQERQTQSLLRSGGKTSKSRSAGQSASGGSAKGTSKKAASTKQQKRDTAETQKSKGADAQKSKAAANGAPDNLQEIKGIGAVLEKKLNALGIERFDQIAAWTDSDIAEIDEALNFRGRIEREGWVEQARELAQRSRGGS